ncbi:putative transcription factor WRKY family [Helianthus anomalus]
MNIDSTNRFTKMTKVLDDGYAWRKYGERNILSSKFPRCYFRCAYKHDQGCKALKQAQKLEDGTNMYRITYIGRHACLLPNTSHLGEELDQWDQELGPDSFLISFEKKIPGPDYS